MRKVKLDNCSDLQLYEESLGLISSMTSIAYFNKNEYFVSLKVIKPDNKMIDDTIQVDEFCKENLSLQLICWNEAMYIKIINYLELKELKEASGLDGSWFSFIKTFIKALKGIDGGSIEILQNKTSTAISSTKQKAKMLIDKTSEETTGSSLEGIFINFYHPLSEGLKIKTQFLLSTQLPKTDNRYPKILKTLFKDIYLQNESLTKDLTKANMKIDAIKFKDNEKAISISQMPEFAINKNKGKRKFHSDLINPNAKKRKHQGVKFVENEEENKNHAVLRS